MIEQLIKKIKDAEEESAVEIQQAEENARLRIKEAEEAGKELIAKVIKETEKKILQIAGDSTAKTDKEIVLMKEDAETQKNIIRETASKKSNKTNEYLLKKIGI